MKYIFFNFLKFCVKNKIESETKKMLDKIEAET